MHLSFIILIYFLLNFHFLYVKINSVVVVRKAWKTMKLDNNNHSVFLLRYHLVLVVKNRKQLIDKNISDRLKDIFVKNASKYNITLEDWDYDKDFVYIWFKGHPNSELSKFINAYKSASSRLMKNEFPKIKSLLTEKQFWGKSFCLLTQGEVDIDTIRQYIETQGEKGG